MAVEADAVQGEETLRALGLLLTATPWSALRLFWLLYVGPSTTR